MARDGRGIINPKERESNMDEVKTQPVDTSAEVKPEETKAPEQTPATEPAK